MTFRALLGVLLDSALSWFGRIAIGVDPVCDFLIDREICSIGGEKCAVCEFFDVFRRLVCRLIV